MAVGRHSVQVTVDGTEKATAELRRVAAAEDAIGESGKKGGIGLRSVEDALERVTGPAGKALRVFNDVGDVFRLMAAGFAGGALFGGLQDIAESLSAIYKSATLAVTSMDDLAAQGLAVNESMLAAKLGVDGLADGIDRYAKSVGLASGAVLTFMQRQAALASIAAGQTRDVGAEEEKTKKLFAKLTELESRLATAVYAGTPEDRLAKLRAEIELAGVAVDDQDLLVQRMKQAGPSASEASTAAWFARTAKDKSSPEAKGGRIGKREPPVDVFGQRNAMMTAHTTAPAPFVGASNDDGEAWQRTLGIGETVMASIMEPLNAVTDAVGEVYDVATEKALAHLEAQRAIAAEGKGMILGFGQAWATSAAAALISGKGFKAATNELFKALAVQALGRSLFEAASGVAMLAVGNVPSATLHFQSAGMFAGIAAGGLVGAAASGGVRGGASARGGGGGEGFGQGRLSPAPPYQQQPQSITVMIGGEEVHAVVVRENDRVIQSGSASRRAFAA